MHLRGYNVSNYDGIWSVNINITSTSAALGKVVMEKSSLVDHFNYVYLAAETSTLESIIVATFNITDGSFLNSMRQRSNSQQLKIASFVTPNSDTSIAYLSCYSLTNEYSEIMKLYIPDSDYVIYQQHSIKLWLQYIDANDKWIGLQPTQHIHISLFPMMSDVMDTVNVTVLKNSGLEDVTIEYDASGSNPSFESDTFWNRTAPTVSDLRYTFSSFVAPSENNQTAVNETTETETSTESTESTESTQSTESTDNTESNENAENDKNTSKNISNDETINTLSMILIAVCGVLVIILVGMITAAACLIKRYKNKKEDISEIQESENQVEEKSSLRQENKA